MRKSTFCALAVLLMVSCGAEQKDILLFDTVSADKDVKLSNDENSPMCSVHLKMAYATAENGDRAEVVNNIIEQRLLDMNDLSMQHAADSFANTYTRSYIGNFLPLYNQDRADTTKRSWYEYHYVIISEAQQGRQGTTVYLATIDYFEGGAHGMNLQQVINFDNKTGQAIELEDIFVAGYESQLNTILLTALCEKTEARDLKELHNKGYLFSMDMFPAKNFILNDETITFIYNPYEIAPYALGSTELTISLSALKQLLKKEYQS